MGSHLSIAEALAQLEAQVVNHKQQLAHHEAQEAHHARQQAFHAEQKLVHEAELRKAIERFEAFKAVSADIGPALAAVKPAAPPPAPVNENISTSGWGWLSRLMDRVIEDKKPGEVFGASDLIGEIYERWGEQVKHIEPRSVSSTLRRWGTEGRLRIVRDGRSYSESLYTFVEEP
jgi:NAD(P)-dependent dehydrogenase (short-subunit alcohol dehydrogenase family)